MPCELDWLWTGFCWLRIAFQRLSNGGQHWCSFFVFFCFFLPRISLVSVSLMNQRRTKGEQLKGDGRNCPENRTERASERPRKSSTSAGAGASRPRMQMRPAPASISFTNINRKKINYTHTHKKKGRQMRVMRPGDDEIRGCGYPLWSTSWLYRLLYPRRGSLPRPSGSIAEMERNIRFEIWTLEYCFQRDNVTRTLMGIVCCFVTVAGKKNIGLQRKTNREERKIDEWEDDSETDWLRATDAIRKEERIRWKGC